MLIFSFFIRIKPILPILNFFFLYIFLDFMLEKLKKKIQLISKKTNLVEFFFSKLRN